MSRLLPRGIYLGTSSWQFPGWAGIVFEPPCTKCDLARNGLAAYAGHPLLRCVGLDRTYYAPLTREQFAEYANQVPADFRFVVKAPSALTDAYVRTAGGRPDRDNPRFLDASFALETFVQPCLEGLGEKCGALVFQFPPLGRSHVARPERIAERLEELLAALPQHLPGSSSMRPVYAVELRNPELLTTRLAQALQASSARLCIGIHPRMSATAQAALLARLPSGALVARWNLHAGFAYDEAKAHYAPFDRLIDEDLASRMTLARLCAAAHRARQCAFVIANNKAEGSVPLTIFQLAEAIADELRGG